MPRLPHLFHCCCLALTLAIAGASGCAGSSTLVRDHAPVELAAHGAPRIAWSGPVLPADLANLGRWRKAVGAPLLIEARSPRPVSDRLVVINWNVHVGAGDVARLLRDVRRQHGPETPIVLLLQEAYRRGPDVPSSIDPAAQFASAIRALRHDGARDDVERIAAAEGLNAYYVPSMRNGGPLLSNEDRGNAILSTIPLSDLQAIELPFERQRRVAVGARVSGVTPAGVPWRVRVVSAHLDNVLGARRLWIAGSELGRARQARGLVAALEGDTPLVLGADLNSWFGFRDAAYRAAATGFPQTRVTDRRPTFGGLLRLDHLFFRLDNGWNAVFVRAEDRYGSDHYPLIGTIRFAPDPGPL